jgi:hypothetical protein
MILGHNRAKTLRYLSRHLASFICQMGHTKAAPRRTRRQHEAAVTYLRIKRHQGHWGAAASGVMRTEWWWHEFVDTHSASMSIYGYYFHSSNVGRGGPLTLTATPTSMWVVVISSKASPSFARRCGGHD